MVAIPIRTSPENLSLEKAENFIVFIINIPNRLKIIAITINHNSSPITDKIKSDS